MESEYGAKMILRSQYLAIGAHAGRGHLRKYTGVPYYRHCEAVADIVAGVIPEEYAAIGAAWLHDTIEDTEIRAATIEHWTNKHIATLVLEVTDVSLPEHGNRAIRKALDRQHLAKASSLGQTIKLADLIDNTTSIVSHDPGFARIYLREKEELLGVLSRGHPVLRERALHILESSKRLLGMDG